VTGVSTLVLALAAGMVIGLFYFGGLLWTLERLPQSKNPSLLMLSSFLFRTGAATVCFYIIMGNRWERVVVSLLGFVVVRMVLVRRLKPERKATGLGDSEI
jgi:F1F0 ATPase subunit 2